MDTGTSIAARTCATGAYEAPALVRLGTVHELTLAGFCDKELGQADGFTFMGAPIVCATSA